MPDRLQQLYQSCISQYDKYIKLLSIIRNYVEKSPRHIDKETFFMYQERERKLFAHIKKHEKALAAFLKDLEANGIIQDNRISRENELKEKREEARSSMDSLQSSLIQTRKKAADELSDLRIPGKRNFRRESPGPSLIDIQG